MRRQGSPFDDQTDTIWQTAGKVCACLSLLHVCSLPFAVPVIALRAPAAKQDFNLEQSSSQLGCTSRSSVLAGQMSDDLTTDSTMQTAAL